MKTNPLDIFTDAYDKLSVSSTKKTKKKKTNKGLRVLNSILMSAISLMIRKTVSYN